jgi:uncharacterized protein YciI
MPIHLCRLLPPRPTFPGDMTPREAGLMQEHAAYWQELADRGVALVVGPVLDPAGAWGLAIVDAPDASRPGPHDADPVVEAGIASATRSTPSRRPSCEPPSSPSV